jgi:citrate synthase
VARFPTMIAAYQRQRTGVDPLPPNPKLPHAANFLAMLTGEEPEEEAARAFDVCLILHADHTMNASTFVARVVASTLSDMHSAITAAIAALKGPLHGGANEAVHGMLEEIDDVDGVEAYVKDRLSRKQKIMGFGHRVYKTEDPRATHLRRLSRELGQRAGDTRWYDVSERIEKVVMDERGLYPNVDFYAASVYHYLGIPTDLMTCVFAASRVVGWSAHVREQLADNRLIRPKSDYIGPRNQTYVPIEERR